MFDHDQIRLQRDILRELCGIHHLLRQIVADLEIPPTLQLPDGLVINQIDRKGDVIMSITGTNAGGQSTFEADALLAGIADPDGFPAGSVDTWTVDDPLASVGPDSGPNQSQVVVSIPSNDTAPSYNLTVSVQMPTPTSGANVGVVPAPLTLTVNVPIIAAAPPVPNGVVINQIA